MLYGDNPFEEAGFRDSETVTIDVDALRSYLLDYCGSAMMSGFPAALIDVVDVERADGEELCRMAERMRVDLRRFVVDDQWSYFDICRGQTRISLP